MSFSYTGNFVPDSYSQEEPRWLETSSTFEQCVSDSHTDKHHYKPLEYSSSSPATWDWKANWEVGNQRYPDKIQVLTTCSETLALQKCFISTHPLLSLTGWWTSSFPSGEGPVLCTTPTISASNRTPHSCQVLVVSPSPQRSNTQQFLLAFLWTYTNTYLLEKTIKQQTSHSDLKGVGTALDSLQELSPQNHAKGTKTLLMETFLRHVSIKVQYQAFRSACWRYWITS